MRHALTTDADCALCGGRGFVTRRIAIGWGPSHDTIRVEQPCKCLQHGLAKEKHDAPRST